jgi:hypothetical protein
MKLLQGKRSRKIEWRHRSLIFMLNHKEKKRIKSEEEFRASLHKAPPAPNKLWTILNSTFVIWLLSAIVLGGLTSFYAAWQQSLRDEEAIQKLDLEIEARLEASERILPYSDFEKPVPYYPANALLFPPGQDRAIQPEFTNRNLRSLLYELNARLPLEEQNDTKLALVEIQAIENRWINKDLKGEEVPEFRQKVSGIHKTRWHWSKMENRGLHIYNRWNRWMMRASVLLLIIMALLGLTGSVLWYRNSDRK